MDQPKSENREASKLGVGQFPETATGLLHASNVKLAVLSLKQEEHRDRLAYVSSRGQVALAISAASITALLTKLSPVSLWYGILWSTSFIPAVLTGVFALQGLPTRDYPAIELQENFDDEAAKHLKPGEEELYANLLQCSYLERTIDHSRKITDNRLLWIDRAFLVAKFALAMLLLCGVTQVFLPSDHRAVGVVNNVARVDLEGVTLQQPRNSTGPSSGTIDSMSNPNKSNGSPVTKPNQGKQEEKSLPKVGETSGGGTIKKSDEGLDQQKRQK